MTYTGHVENGTIVLDEPVALPDGAVVEIELAGVVPNAGESSGTDTDGRFPLRGLAYRYDAPLEPAISEQEWAADE
ncbi:MAG TPA: hypothetical protein PLO37_18035 [Candidatus Hydrogenedentes bacterium]|nr:hypothetical protein [Candidatus Hydrogenedentota bacterium]HPG68751.1 hypothetical protein [Candidatus Hydrogenedentota bacterium]